MYTNEIRTMFLENFLEIWGQKLNFFRNGQRNMLDLNLRFSILYDEFLVNLPPYF